MSVCSNDPAPAIKWQCLVIIIPLLGNGWPFGNFAWKMAKGQQLFLTLPLSHPPSSLPSTCSLSQSLASLPSPLPFLPAPSLSGGEGGEREGRGEGGKREEGKERAKKEPGRVRPGQGRRREERGPGLCLGPLPPSPPPPPPPPPPPMIGLTAV